MVCLRVPKVPRERALVVTLCLLAAPLCLSRAAHAAPRSTVEGTIVVRALERFSGQAYWPPEGTGLIAPRPATFPAGEVMVLFFASDSHALPSAPQKAEEIYVQGADFSPRVLAVPAGTTVTFFNKDRTPYVLYSPRNESFFGAEPLAPGASRAIRFLAPGVYFLRTAELHHMQGVVIVHEPAVAALADAQGKFHVAALTPGNYGLKVFVRGRMIAERAFAVSAPPKPQTIDIEITEPVQWPSP